MCPPMKTSLLVVWLFYIVYATCMYHPQGSSSGGGSITKEEMAEKKLREKNFQKCKKLTTNTFGSSDNVSNLSTGFLHYNEDSFFSEENPVGYDQRTYVGGYWKSLLPIALETIVPFERQILEEKDQNAEEYEQIYSELTQKIYAYYNNNDLSSPYPAAPLRIGRFKILSPKNFCLYEKKNEINTCFNIFLNHGISVDITGAEAFEIFYKQFVISKIREENDILKEYMWRLIEMFQVLNYKNEDQEDLLPSPLSFCEHIFSSPPENNEE